MPKRLNRVKVPLGEKLEDVLGWMHPGHGPFRILRESVDARRRHDVHRVFAVDVFDPDEPVPNDRTVLERIANFSDDPVLIVGAGPAGLFAALRLAERGIPCRLFEQGSPAEKRIMGINRFWRYGRLDPRNNVGFGEGGAGLYSDGKLITRIRSPFIPYVMERLVDFGAPEEIRYLANPHVGSDKIRRVIPKLRRRLEELNCQLHFDTKISEILFADRRVVGLKTERGDVFRASHVVLASGHSAQDVFSHLREAGVALEGKSFALGLRIEHPQRLINQIQYRRHVDHPDLGAANYKLTYHDSTENFGVYSFCMCPGGYVLSSATEDGHMVTNGMSNFKRNSPFANSALVVTVDHAARFGSDVFGGMDFRNRMEREAFEMARHQGDGRALPAQRLEDFLHRRSGGAGETSSPSGVVPARLDQLFSTDDYRRLCAGFEDFFKRMPEFRSDQALLHGVESRTSCPVRIPRDPETLESTSHGGLFPCGEGAGYAGGITSSACDGIRVAERIYQLHH